jgi:hypothetical protein
VDLHASFFLLTGVALATFAQSASFGPTAEIWNFFAESGG